jgi:hypothetical protein
MRSSGEQIACKITIEEQGDHFLKFWEEQEAALSENMCSKTRTFKRNV